MSEQLLIFCEFHVLSDLYCVCTVFHLNARYYPTIKWQFFVTADGVHTEYPAHSFSGVDCPSTYATRHR